MVERMRCDTCVEILLGGMRSQDKKGWEEAYKQHLLMTHWQLVETQRTKRL